MAIDKRSSPTDLASQRSRQSRSVSFGDSEAIESDHCWEAQKLKAEKNYSDQHKPSKWSIEKTKIETFFVLSVHVSRVNNFCG